uniref:Cryptochrome/DNA photolyase FAD-binding domain-containing protein n=1 Tax=viral metagenome TaxID=1070528 RepID=A0A6C0H777_9ZZZZ
MELNNNITLIFPTQLFKNIKYIKTKNIYLIEEPLYFTYYKFHKMKLAYHRATMKWYYDYLKNKLKNRNIKYINYYKVDDNFYKELKYNNIYIINPIEHQLTNKLKNIFKDRLIIKPTLNFLLKDSDIEYIKKTFFKKSYNHRIFYLYQRHRLEVLINKDNEPDFSRWNFDDENRKKLPKNIDLPKPPKIINNKYTKEAIIYVNKYFNNNYGEINFIYPITHKNSVIWLNNFLKNKLYNFGLYEDAVSEQNVFIFHSILSPMMNIGLLVDEFVVTHTLKYYNKNTDTISIENIEGFIRQIIGWRNYIYSIYMIEKPIIKNNNSSSSIQYHKFWKGTTDMYPIDSIIKNKIIPYAYCHHIERLMYLGNFMKLCMLEDMEIYKLFMEWTIDSYEWVMWGNIFGMVLNKIKIMKKNYISSSNYLLKMSNFKNTNNWSYIFNCLYYHYISKNIKLLKKDYILSIQVSRWKKKTDKHIIIQVANNFIKSLKND